MASNISGKSAILALYIPGTADQWGTAGTLGAECGLVAESIGPIGEVAEMVPDPSAGYAWHEYIDKARQIVNPEISGLLRFAGKQWSLIAYCMGLDTPTGTPVSHVMTIVEAIDGTTKWGTLGLQLGPAAGELLLEWPSVKMAGFTIEGPNGDGYYTYTVRTIADACLLGADCGVDASAFDNVTFLQVNSVFPPPVPFGATKFRVAAASGGALADGNAVKIKSLNLTFNRNMGQEWNTRSTAAKQWRTDEPVEEGIPEGTLTVEIGDLNALTYMEQLQDETEVKADITIPYTATYGITIEFPCLKVVNVESAIAGANRIPQKITYQMMEAQSNPTGMAFNTWQLTLVDDKNVY